MWLRWSEAANVTVNGSNATIGANGGSVYLPGGSDLAQRLCELLRRPQPRALIEQELAKSAASLSVGDILDELLLAEVLLPWNLSAKLTLLHQQTLSGGEEGTLSPALETARFLRETGDGLVTLLPPVNKIAVSLQSALEQRRTCRSFLPQSASLSQLGSILDLAARADSNRDGALRVPGAPPAARPYPSGGALYPVEIIIHAAAVTGLEPAFYLYQPLNHALVRVASSPEQKVSALMAGHAVDNATFSALLFLDFTRLSFSKYGGKMYRLALIEAGHVAQNFVLAASALGLSSLPLCGFDDEALTTAAGLQYPEQPVVYVISIGCAATELDD